MITREILLYLSAAGDLAAERDLLARRLGMNIDDDDARLVPEPLKLVLDDPERTLDRLHEDTADQIDNADVDTRLRRNDHRAEARRA